MEFAKLYYLLDIEAYKKGDIDLAIELFTISSDIYPETSYFHVELANLYLNIDNKKLSSEAVDRCKMHDDANMHCNEYETHNLNQNIPEQVGFLKEKNHRFVLKFFLIQIFRIKNKN